MLEDLQETIDQNSNLKYIFIGLIVVLVSLVGWLFWQQLHTNVKQNRVTTVTLGDGQNQVIVRRDGVVTIKTPYGTFTQNWNPDKIKQFFAQLDNLDFESLSQYLGSDLAVKLTFGNNQEKIISIEDVPPDLLQAFQDALEEIYNTELGDKLPFVQNPTNSSNWLNPDENNSGFGSDNAGNGSTNNNSGNNSNSSQTSNDNPWHQGTDVNDQVTFDCSQGSDGNGHKIVISNTVCEN